MEGQQFKDRDGCHGFIGVHITAFGSGGEVIGICRGGRFGAKVFYRKEDGKIGWEYSRLIRIAEEGKC